MGLQRPLVALSILGLVAATPIATPTGCGESATGLPRLCETTVIIADETSSMFIELVDDVAFTPTTLGLFTDQGGALEIDGSGSFPGVVISQTRSDGTTHGIIAGRVDAEDVGMEVVEDWGDIEGDQGQGFTLPAGVYRLTVLADSAITTVTLRSDTAASGEVHLSTTMPASATVDRLDDSFSATPSVIASGGAAYPLEGPGVALRAVYILAAPHAVSDLGTCISRSPPPDGYLPHCPGFRVSDEPGFVFNFPAVAPSGGDVGVGFYSVTTGLSGPEVAQGVWYESAGLVQEAGAVGAWIPLPPDE